MVKVALVLPTNLWFCPYIDPYIEILKENNISYDIICWDKRGKASDEGIVFHREEGNNKISKLFGYFLYSIFVKKIIQKNKYTHLILFYPHVGIMLSSFLKNHYKGKYIFDYRDISIEQIGIFRTKFKTLLANSFINVISSPGFKSVLPKKFSYILCHNFIKTEVEKGIKKVPPKSFKSPLEILTIGSIRDYSSNKEIIDALGNNQKFHLRFVGKGDASDDLSSYAKNNRFSNVSFKGYYDKSEEPGLIKPSDFINIYYPNNLLSQTSLSNRFYHCLVYRKPMIVTKGHTHALYCEKYNLGISIYNTDNLADAINEWVNNFDYNTFENNCINLLRTFLEDYNLFRKKLLKFIES